MSDDEVDEELQALLRKSLGLDAHNVDAPAKTGVLEDAEYVYDNSVDVAIDMRHTKKAALELGELMQTRGYSTQNWKNHPLHPQSSDEKTVNFIFYMDLLNFSFWPDQNDHEPFTVIYNDKHWTGYSALVAIIRRAADEGIPFTDPAFWLDEERSNPDVLQQIFRSSTDSRMPLIAERIDFLRQSSRILHERFNDSFVICIEEARQSAAGLVNLVVDTFPAFADEAQFQGRRVRFLKRAQILVADLWACFDGKSFGAFNDMDQITMFADYRVPQMLHSLGCLQYSPKLDHHVRQKLPIEKGHPWEVQLRGCSIWAVEMLRRLIQQQHPELVVNAVLLDFFLYDLGKEREAQGISMVPHHRTRTTCY